MTGAYPSLDLRSVTSVFKIQTSCVLTSFPSSPCLEFRCDTWRCSSYIPRKWWQHEDKWKSEKAVEPAYQPRPASDFLLHWANLLFLSSCCWISVICEGESESCSVMSDSLRPHGLYSLWNSPGQNTGVGSFSLRQGIFPTKRLNPGLPHCRRILYHL